MRGTTTEQTPAIRRIPPRMTTRASRATATPVVRAGTEKLSASAPAMELAWAMSPMPREARTVKRAKRKARAPPSRFHRRAAVKTYILNNTTKQSAAKLLYDFRYSLDEAVQNEIIAKADSAFKAVPNIDKLMAHLDVLKTVAVGKKFVDFEMADPNGKTHKLSEFVGNGKNIVLIDFWASWCPPCRRDMPNLVAAYKKYKNKGFEIVGISLDSKADAWAKGVKDLNITWTQLSDLQGWKNSGAQLYGVNSIPHTVLVDKDGTIIAKNLHGEEIDAKLQEILK